MEQISIKKWNFLLILWVYMILSLFLFVITSSGWSPLGIAYYGGIIFSLILIISTITIIIKKDDEYHISKKLLLILIIIQLFLITFNLGDSGDAGLTYNPITKLFSQQGFTIIPSWITEIVYMVYIVLLVYLLTNASKKISF